MTTLPFFHSTHWDGLNAVIAEELIRPGPLSFDDKRSAPLGKLASKNLHFAWFSSQRWSSSNFGAYVFRIDGNALVTSRLVSIGKHNGARCYVAAPSMLAQMIANTLGSAPIDALTDLSWQPRSDRVDILAPWPVPAGHDIEFTSSNRVDDRGCDDSVSRARARFTAKMIISKNHHFDHALAATYEVAEDVLRALLGITSSAFDKRVEAALAKPMPVTTSYIDIALAALAAGDIAAAGQAAAYYLSEIEVARKVALALSLHFSRLVDGQVLYDRLEPKTPS